MNAPQQISLEMKADYKGNSSQALEHLTEKLNSEFKHRTGMDLSQQKGHIDEYQATVSYTGRFMREKEGTGTGDTIDAAIKNAVGDKIFASGKYKSDDIRVAVTRLVDVPCIKEPVEVQTTSEEEALKQIKARQAELQGIYGSRFEEKPYETQYRVIRTSKDYSHGIHQGVSQKGYKDNPVWSNISFADSLSKAVPLRDRDMKPHLSTVYEAKFTFVIYGTEGASAIDLAKPTQPEVTEPVKATPQSKPVSKQKSPKKKAPKKQKSAPVTVPAATTCAASSATASTHSPKKRQKKSKSYGRPTTAGSEPAYPFTDTLM